MTLATAPSSSKTRSRPLNTDHLIIHAGATQQDKSQASLRAAPPNSKRNLSALSVRAVDMP
jgi:hypothetical protein